MSAVIEPEKLTKTYGKSRGSGTWTWWWMRQGVRFPRPNGAGKTAIILSLLGVERNRSSDLRGLVR